MGQHLEQKASQRLFHPSTPLFAPCIPVYMLAATSWCRAWILLQKLLCGAPRLQSIAKVCFSRWSRVVTPRDRLALKSGRWLWRLLLVFLWHVHIALICLAWRRTEVSLSLRLAIESCPQTRRVLLLDHRLRLRPLVCCGWWASEVPFLRCRSLKLRRWPRLLWSGCDTLWLPLVVSLHGWCCVITSRLRLALERRSFTEDH